MSDWVVPLVLMPVAVAVGCASMWIARIENPQGRKKIAIIQIVNDGVFIACCVLLILELLNAWGQ